MEFIRGNYKALRQKLHFVGLCTIICPDVHLPHAFLLKLLLQQRASPFLSFVFVTQCCYWLRPNIGIFDVKHGGLTLVHVNQHRLRFLILSYSSGGAIFGFRFV